MNWLPGALILALVYATLHREKVSQWSSLRTSWICFLCIPIANALFSMIKAGGVEKMNSPQGVRGAASTEFWNNGIVWVIVAVSVYWLMDALIPKESLPAAAGSDGTEGGEGSA